MRLLDRVSAYPWAIMPEVVPDLVAVAERAGNADPKVLEAYRAKTLEKAERAGERDGVAILYVDGPLFKHANFMVRYSGATSYQILRRDLQAAIDNPDIHSILLVVDSPGGEANGCDELATAISEARAKKPITAFVSGMAASGGYWIASAASKIVISDAAMLGSIGVVLGVPDKRAEEARTGRRTFEFVSSQSPGKRPDPESDDGRQRIQSMVDDLAAVFVSAVARYRGVSTDTVIKKFGGGGMLVGAAAVKAGMADEVGQLEATIASLQRERSNTSAAIRASAPRAPKMSNRPVPTISADDVAGSIQAIVTSDHARAMPTLSNFLAFESGAPADAALAIMATARQEIGEIAAMAPAARQIDPRQASEDFLARKRAAGALMGDGTITTAAGEIDRGTAAAAHGWQAAVARTNAIINPAAPSGTLRT
jgi:signal peptide peptidase SppA